MKKKRSSRSQPIQRFQGHGKSPYADEKREQMIENHRFYDEVINTAANQLKALGFTELDPNGGDRHGGWYYNWIHKKGRRDENVGIGFYYLGNDEYAVNVWAGVSDGGRFGLRCVWKCEPVGGRDINFLGVQLAVQIVRACEIAKTWRKSELPYKYP